MTSVHSVWVHKLLDVNFFNHLLSLRGLWGKKKKLWGALSRISLEWGLHCALSKYCGGWEWFLHYKMKGLLTHKTSAGHSVLYLPLGEMCPNFQRNNMLDLLCILPWWQVYRSLLSKTHPQSQQLESNMTQTNSGQRVSNSCRLFS